MANIRLDKLEALAAAAENLMKEFDVVVGYDVPIPSRISRAIAQVGHRLYDLKFESGEEGMSEENNIANR